MNIYRCKVFFEDTDATQIVYHANYLKFCDRARTQWLTSAGLSFDDLYDGSGASVVVAEATLKFVQAARLGDELEIHSKLASIGKVEMTFAQDVINRHTQQSVCQVTVRCAFVSGQPLRPVRIPQKFLTLFANEVNAT